MGFLLTCYGWGIDTDTFKMEKIREPIIADVPYFMAKDIHDSYIHPYNLFTGTYTLKLNNLTIEMKDWFSRPGLMEGEQEAFISIFDTRKNKKTEIDLSVFPHWLYTYQGGPKRMYLGDVAYMLDRGGAGHNKTIEYQPRIYNPRFQPINVLPMVNTPKTVDDAYSYGIAPWKYHVIYAGKRLSGKCYAFLFGTWAILLRDDFQYDSLVYLEEVDEVKLTVAYIAHSINPYMVKMAMLVR